MNQPDQLTIMRREREALKKERDEYKYLADVRLQEIERFAKMLEAEPSRATLTVEIEKQRRENLQLKNDIAHLQQQSEAFRQTLKRNGDLQAENERLRAELEAYRTNGVTEEILRRHDGTIKLGNGCVIVRDDEWEAMRAELAQAQQALTITQKNLLGNDENGWAIFVNGDEMDEIRAALPVPPQAK